MIAFTDKVLNAIRDSIGSCDNESGGIIGTTNGIDVTEYQFDRESFRDEYVPDVSRLNGVLKEWAEKGIKFIGIIHSHITRNALSTADIVYARSIMRLNGMNRIIMPVFVGNDKKIYVYNVTNDDVLFLTTVIV